MQQIVFEKRWMQTILALVVPLVYKHFWMVNIRMFLLESKTITAVSSNLKKLVIQAL